MAVLSTTTLVKDYPGHEGKKWIFDPIGVAPGPTAGRINEGAACMPPSVVVAISAYVYTFHTNYVRFVSHTCTVPICIHSRRR